MSQVSRIDWTFFTGAAEGSGTDSEVSLEILRDGNQIVAVDDEPGETARLDRGEIATRYWQFQNPTGIGTAVSGVAVPYTEDFPAGVHGHLVVRIRIHGDDAWRKTRIESNVWTGELRGVPGTIVEDEQQRRTRDRRQRRARFPRCEQLCCAPDHLRAPCSSARSAPPPRCHVPSPRSPV